MSFRYDLYYLNGGNPMYKNKTSNGKNNLCGEKIYLLRKQLRPRVSQRAFAEKLQLNGIDLDKNAIQRIECGKRLVTDIELKVFAQILNTTTDELLNTDDKPIQ